MSLVAAVLLTPLGVAAQPAVSVSAGAASYDLSGVGTSGVGAVRAEFPLASRLDLQVGTSFFWYGTQFDREIAMLFPEIGVFVRPSSAFPLLVGLGAGHSVGVKGDPEDDPTLYGSLALEIEDRAGWAVRPEMRLRAVDPWTGTVGEFTLGVRRRLGPT